MKSKLTERQIAIKTNEKEMKNEFFFKKKQDVVLMEN